MADKGHMAGRKKHASQIEEDYEEEEYEGEEGEEGGEEYEDEEECAEDEESGAGENAAEEDDRIQMTSQQKTPTSMMATMMAEAAAAKRTMMACPVDMSLWKTSWTIIVRPPNLALFKKAIGPTGINMLDHVGMLKYCAATKKTEPSGKTSPLINLWVNKAGVITRFGLSRRLFMPQEVRDPGARITAGKFKNAPDPVSINQPYTLAIYELHSICLILFHARNLTVIL
jgi:hypothetical protein